MTDDLRPLPHHALSRLSDEDLLAYVSGAQASGAPAEARRALWHLVERYAKPVTARLRFDVPDHLVEDMTHDVLVAAIEAALAGREIKNFSAWLNRVVANQRADFFRSKAYQQLKQDREATAHEPSADTPKTPPREQSVEGGYGEVDVRELIELVMASRSETHRRVIDLYVFEGLPASATSQQTGESQDNVYKVAQRFRDDVRGLLDGGELEAPPDATGRPSTDTAPAP